MGGYHDKPGRPRQKPGRLRLDHGHPVFGGVVAAGTDQDSVEHEVPAFMCALFSSPFPSATNV